MLHNDVLGRDRRRASQTSSVSSFSVKRAGGTGHDALAAGDAGDIGQALFKGAADVGVEAALVGADDADRLQLGLHAATQRRHRMHLELSRTI